MQFLRQSWFGISTVLALVILFFTQCSDTKDVQKEIIKETINLNKHVEETVVTKPIVKTNPEVEKFKKQRDEAVERTSTIREKNALLKKKTAELNKKIEELKADQEKAKAEFHTKLAASSSDFLAAKALSDKLLEQKEKVVTEKKVITKVTPPKTETPKANKEAEKKQQEIEKLTTKLSHLEEKLSKVTDKNYELKSIISDKNAAISSAIYDKKDAIKALNKKFDIRKNEEVEKLTKERNEAIKVSLGMKNQLESLTNKLSHLEQKLQSSIKDKQSLKGSLKNAKEEDKEKLATSSSEVSNLKGIISSKNVQITHLTHDKEKIERTLSKKINEILEEKSKNSTLFKTKLASFEKLLSSKEVEIQKLISQRDEAIEACKK